MAKSENYLKKSLNIYIDKPMTLYEFNILTLEEKQATVWKIGLFLDNYKTKDVKINCYAIDKFFVEVHYNAEHNTITGVTAFKSGHELDKYSNLTI